MYCNSCGHHNPDGAKYCSGCGASLRGGSNDEHVDTVPAGLAQSTPAAEGFDEEAWRTVIGKNADYYLPRFRTLAAGGAAPRWHWPAFFVTWYWMLHRKMWGKSLLYLVAPSAIGFVLGLVLALAGVPRNTAQPLIGLGFFLLFFLGPPMFANTWYFRHCEKVMAKAEARTSNRAGYLGFLSAKGGSGGAAVIAVVVFVLIFVIGVLAAVAIPAYQDYTKRAKLAEVVLAGRTAAIALGNHYVRTREIPARVEEIPGAPRNWPALVDQVEVDQHSGEISLHLSRMGTLRMRPRLNGDEVTVQCSSQDIKPAWLPPACRPPR